MNKFILTRKPHKYTQTESARPQIRITEESYQELIQMAYESGMSITAIASKSIAFAHENLEYVEMEQEGQAMFWLGVVSTIAAGLLLCVMAIIYACLRIAGKEKRDDE